MDLYLYDNDTCFGLNNEGLIAFGYNIEYHDKIGTLNVWNGESSVLWNNLEKCFPSEIEAMYKDIRTRGLLSYDLIMSVLNGEQSDNGARRSTTPTAVSSISTR